MKIKYLLLSLVSCMIIAQGRAQERSFLTGKFSRADLQELLLSKDNFKPYPVETQKWAQTPESLKQLYVKKAEELLGTRWGELKATEFMQYKRNGNRNVFEGISFERRSKLAALVMGELFENKGRFTDDIINGVWVICEESWWGVPAHNGHKGNRDALPDLDNPYVDLFDAETGAALAWTYYLMKEKMDKVSPFVGRRIMSELESRIIVPCMENDYNWMGFRGESLNNWTPWICSNWLTVVLLCDTNPARRLDAVYRSMQILDRFINPYPLDGGCDEGPGYWGRAGASLFDCLEILHQASNGKINIFDQPLIANIATYIYKVHIADDYYVNFADASAVVRPDASLINRYGKAINDATMQQYASYLADRYRVKSTASSGALGRLLPALFHLSEISDGAEAPLARDVWFPELQVAIARSGNHSAEGLYLAAKGGHNSESHNHNDIGSFVVYADGKPVLIDIGVETYTAQTFSSKRYDIWTMQSAYHNLPTVNGVQQSPGREFAARNVSYSSTGKRVIFSLDIAKAYPESAKVESWKRKLTLERGLKIDVEDTYILKETVEPSKWHLISCIRPDVNIDGKIILPNGNKKVIIDYDKSQLSAQMEEINVTDQRLLPVWGSKVYRINLTEKKQTLKGTCRLSISYKNN